MKVIINENQYELLKEMEDKPKVYNFPSLDVFGHKKPMDNWNLMQKFLAKRGNPDFTIGLTNEFRIGEFTLSFLLDIRETRNNKSCFHYLCPGGSTRKTLEI